MFRGKYSFVNLEPFGVGDLKESLIGAQDWLHTRSFTSAQNLFCVDGELMIFFKRHSFASFIYNGTWGNRVTNHRAALQLGVSF